MFRVVILLLFSTLLISCGSTKQISNATVEQQPSFGSSGMDQVSPSSYIAVYDLKNFQEGTRLSLIRTYKDSIKVTPIKVNNWLSTESIPSDLEAVSKIPDRHDEYLITESGNWQGKLGRIFHIKVDFETHEAKVLGIASLPVLSRNDLNGVVGDQYEGLACIECTSNECLVLIAERGGSQIYPNGIIKWATLDLSNYQLTFSDRGLKGIEVIAPGNWSAGSMRDITDLHVDDDGMLWAAASQDLGDAGPFYSVIYQIGYIASGQDVPVVTLQQPQIYRELSGFKIEALSGPSSSAPGSRFAFGTEDEIYGGTWRPVE